MKTLIAALIVVALANAAVAQGAKIESQSGGTSSVIIQNGTVVTQSTGIGNSASVTTGVAPGAQVQGITVINGQVWIDGEQVPQDAKRFTGRSGKSYVIERNGGSVNVHEQ